MPALVPARQVAAVREFNRFYTRRIGLLDEGLLGSEYSLTEVRVLYELAHRKTSSATELGRELGLDAGYLSRILRKFERTGVLRKEPAPSDGRRQLLHLTAKGRRAFQPLDRRSAKAIEQLLAPLTSSEQQRLLDGMRSIRQTLSPAPEPAAVHLRAPQAGDMGWVIQRHGALYRQEYGWDERFEALVAEIVADFMRQHDPACERCWIAERGGENVGCVFLVRKSKTVAKLRLLLVEPAARGHGIGSLLVKECIAFARQAGYRKMALWTNSVLHAARRIYEAEGFRLVREERHDLFGRNETGQSWELQL